MRIRNLGKLLIFAFMLFLPLSFGCGDGNGNGGPDPDPPVPDSIALSADTLEFKALRDTARVTATVLDQYGDAMSGITVVWAIDGPLIAAVDQTGLVTSGKEGETTLRAQAGTVRESLTVTVTQEAALLEARGGENQLQWTGFPLADSLGVRLTDGAGTAVVGANVTWEVKEGGGTISPEGPRTDDNGELKAQWVLGTGESGIQEVSATHADLDPVIFTATGTAPAVLKNDLPLTGPMLDTIDALLETRDSVGVPQSGVSVEFVDITGFGEIAQGPTTSDVNGELTVRWILGPTPGPQELTVVRTDIGSELPLTAAATGVLDPWPFEIVATGFMHTCAIDNANKAFCWGGNEQAQLATEDSLPVKNPLEVPTAATWSDIGGGEFHTCALSTGGTTFCWGQGWQTGQAWDSLSLVESPTAVTGGDFQSLTVGGYHNCGLKADGTALCWGDELEGRLGNGTLVPTHTPTPVGGGLVWTQLAAGHFHTCGIDQDGDAYCWGRGQEGQVGDGGEEDRTAPALVANGYKWAELSAGRFHTCGITDGGQTFCWGRGQANSFPSVPSITTNCFSPRMAA